MVLVPFRLAREDLVSVLLWLSYFCKSIIF